MVSLPDERSGETPHAVVVWREGEKVNEAGHSFASKPRPVLPDQMSLASRGMACLSGSVKKGVIMVGAG